MEHRIKLKKELRKRDGGRREGIVGRREGERRKGRKGGRRSREASKWESCFVSSGLAFSATAFWGVSCARDNAGLIFSP